MDLRRGGVSPRQPVLDHVLTPLMGAQWYVCAQTLFYIPNLNLALKESSSLGQRQDKFKISGNMRTMTVQGKQHPEDKAL